MKETGVIKSFLTYETPIETYYFEIVDSNLASWHAQDGSTESDFADAFMEGWNSAKSNSSSGKLPISPRVGRSISENQVNLIRELHNQGLSNSQISTKTGLAWRTVVRHVERMTSIVTEPPQSAT